VQPSPLHCQRVSSFADFIDREHVPAQADPLSASDYETRTRAVLAAIEAAADRFLQDDVIDIDAGRTGGLLELAFPNGSRSSSTPSRRCRSCGWRRSLGGFHFRRVGGRWIDGRDGREFFACCRRARARRRGRRSASRP
jgi:CyaY protein